ncbi:hypothetical protein D3C76_1547240 [compost metagenome]
MIQRVDFFRVVVRTTGLVADKGVVFPTVPKPGDHLMKLSRPAVALGVTKMLGAAKVQRLGGIVGRHQVPPRASS